MRKYVVSLFIFSLVIWSMGDIHASFAVPTVPSAPTKTDPMPLSDFLHGTSTPAQNTPTQGKPSPTTTTGTGGVAPSSTPVPLIGGGGREPSPTTSSSSNGVPSSNGSQVKTLSATAGEEYVEKAITLAGIMFLLTGFKLLWAKERNQIS